MLELLARMRALLDTMPTDPTVRGLYDLCSAMEERVSTITTRLNWNYSMHDSKELGELAHLLERA